MNIYKSEVKPKDGRTARLQVTLVGPDGGHAPSRLGDRKTLVLHYPPISTQSLA